MLGGGKPPISGQGRGLKPEAQKPRAGVRFFGRGQPARGSERCKLPQRDPGTAPANNRFSCILEAPEGLS